MSSEKPFSLKDIFNKKKEKNPRPAIGQYIYPFKHPNPESVPIEDHPVTHAGPYKGAMDFMVEVGTTVIAADDGIVVKAETGHTKYGDNPKYKDELNYITIYHPKTKEYSQYCHLGKTYVIQYDKVFQGDQIAKTDLNGYMDNPHLHFFVFKSQNNKVGFIGLKPNLKPLIL